MNFESAIRGRRSIRQFKPDAVRPEIIREILDEARWSPSWANTQAWNIYVVTSNTLERLKDAGTTPSEPGASAGPDFRMPGEWPPHLAARTKQLFELRAAFAPGPTGPSEFFGAPIGARASHVTRCRFSSGCTRASWPARRRHGETNRSGASLALRPCLRCARRPC